MTRTEGIFAILHVLVFETFQEKDEWELPHDNDSSAHGIVICCVSARKHYEGFHQKWSQHHVRGAWYTSSSHVKEAIKDGKSPARWGGELSLPVSPSQRWGDRSTSKNTNYSRLRHTAYSVFFLFLKKFPGDPVATTLGFQCSGPEFNPCSGNWILGAAPRTQSNLINK